MRALFRQRLQEWIGQAGANQPPMPDDLTIDEVFRLIKEVGEQTFDHDLAYASEFMLHLAAVYANPATCDANVIAKTMNAGNNVMELFGSKGMGRESARVFVLMYPLINLWKASGQLAAAEKLAGISWPDAPTPA